jgi:hypothetical protein
MDVAATMTGAALALPGAVLGVAIATGRGVVGGVSEEGSLRSKGRKEGGAVSLEQEQCLSDPVLATIQLLVSCMGQERMVFRAQGWPLLRAVLAGQAGSVSLQHRLLRDLIPALLLARTDGDEVELFPPDVSVLELLLENIRPRGLSSLASSFFGNDAALQSCRDIGQVRARTIEHGCANSCVHPHTHTFAQVLSGPIMARGPTNQEGAFACLAFWLQDVLKGAEQWQADSLYLLLVEVLCESAVAISVHMSTISTLRPGLTPALDLVIDFVSPPVAPRGDMTPPPPPEIPTKDPNKGTHVSFVQLAAFYC